MKYEYEPKGVCSKKFEFDIDEDIVKELKIIGGCPGNTMGISILVRGMKIDDIIKKLKGIPCRDKKTSCPDQIANALEKYLKITG